MDLQTFCENVDRKMNTTNGTTKPAPRLTPEAIAAVNRVLARGDEVKISALNDGLRVSAVRYKTEYRAPGGVDNPART